MSTLKFTLNVTIEGESLGEIDDALIAAATTRLMSRLQNPPSLNGVKLPPPPTQIVDKAAEIPLNLKMKIDEKVSEVIKSSSELNDKTAARAQVPSDSEKRRAGRPRKDISNGKIETDNRSEETDPSRKIGSTSGPSVEQGGLREGVDHKRETQGHPEQQTGARQQADQKDPVLVTQPTKDDAVNALSKVNSAKGIDAARAILTKFEAKRLGELAPEKFGAFIQACNQSL